MNEEELNRRAKEMQEHVEEMLRSGQTVMVVDSETVTTIPGELANMRARITTLENKRKWDLPAFLIGVVSFIAWLVLR